MTSNHIMALAAVFCMALALAQLVMFRRQASEMSLAAMGFTMQVVVLLGLLVQRPPEDLTVWAQLVTAAALGAGTVTLLVQSMKSRNAQKVAP